MKTKASDRNSLPSFSGSQNHQPAATEDRFSYSITASRVLRILPELELHTSRRANVVLSLAVEENRQVIDLNRAYIQVAAGMNIQSSAEGHGERGVGFGSVGRQIIERRAHVRETEQRVHERSHAIRTPVVSGSGEQIIALHARAESSA